MTTKTMTTYHKTRMLGGYPIEPRGPNCESAELAHRSAVPGPETAIVRSDFRLGGDGDWHLTTEVIVEWEVKNG